MRPKQQSKDELAQNSQKIQCTESGGICAMGKGSQNGDRQEE